jgi:predicted nucleic acid-binding protein
MTGENLRAYYWDSCIFLEHFRTSEPVSATKRQAIRRLLETNKKEKNIIFTSALAHLEVLPKKLNAEDAVAEEKYWNLFKSKFFYEIAIDAQVAKLGRSIKDFYYQEGVPKEGIPYRMMDTGDAIHLATAIINEADEFHTRDNKTKKGNVPLLDLHKYSPNGLVMGKYPLTIVSPDEEQQDWLLDQGDGDSAW